MEHVGIRDLKAHLSRHLRRVQTGTRLLVTDRGRRIAVLGPIELQQESPELAWARRMVVAGRVQWTGGKPRGFARRLARTSDPRVSDAVLEDRR